MYLLEIIYSFYNIKVVLYCHSKFSEGVFQIIKNIKKLKMVTMLCVLCSLLLIFSACAEEQEVSEKNFLKKNHQKLDIDNFSKITLLDTEIKGKEIFFTSEYYGVYPNQKLQMNFLKYLKEKTDIKYLICEMSCGDAVIMNKYLETGDEEVLKLFFKNGKESANFTDDLYEFFKDLYTFNKTLSDEGKIKIVGVDMELIYDNSVWALDSLVPKGDIPEKIKLSIDKLKYTHANIHKSNIYKSIKAKPIQDIYELSTNLVESIEQNTSIYENYLGDNYFDFKTVADNLKYTCGGYLAMNGEYIENRNETMYTNFQKYYSKLPKGKYFGQFGMNNIFEKGIRGKEYFASLLNSETNSPVKGKILSIVYLYNTNADFYFANNCSPKLIELTEPYFKSDLTLFKLTGKDSPFQKSLFKYCFPSKGEEELYNLSDSNGEVTTDYFQYILIIRNAKQGKLKN
jgi:hypothetical protein